MPFIRGRYHINAIAGEALEAARAAEAALLALEHDAAQFGAQHDVEDEHDDNSDAEDGGEGTAQNTSAGPIHRVEIEAAELVPAHSGRAQRSFVAHVHRAPIQPDQGNRSFTQSAGRGGFDGIADASHAGIASLRSPQAGQLPTAGNASRPETHVFADHRDLVSFLRDEFAKNCKHGS